MFSVFIFIFCLEPTVREQLDENDFRHYFGIFFKGTIMKLLDQSYVQAFLQRHLKDILRKTSLKDILRTWINIGTNSFLSKNIKGKSTKLPGKLSFTQ